MIRTLCLSCVSLLLALALSVAGPAADWIWIEGEAAHQQNVARNSWYESVPRGAFSAGGFLAHFDDAQPGTAQYTVQASEAGDYSLWLRANPHNTQMSFQLNGGDWKQLPYRKVLQRFPLAGWDMRFLGWIQAGSLSLRAGDNELHLRFEGDPRPHGMLDCFVLTRIPFSPFGIASPDEVSLRRRQQAADEANWFGFKPRTYTRAISGRIDLRWMNEQFAGEGGRILSRDGQFVHAKSGKPVRFWAVNGPPDDLKSDAFRECARLLASRGVNLVRMHGAVFDKRTGDFRPAAARRIVQGVQAMKAEGIYTHLSVYFPLWFTPQAGLEWLPGYDGNQHPFATLMFNEKFQQRYEQWWRDLLTAKLGNGRPLYTEPALMGVEIQNEDSFFFWTFNESNLPDPQLRLLEKQFGDWLIQKYGSLPEAFQAWGDRRLSRDNEAEGRVAFRPLWEMFNLKTARDRDTASFLYDTQWAFYQRAIRSIRDLGFQGLVTCSNWATASPEVFGPLENLSYTAGDFIDHHGYVGCRNGGLFSEWSIRDGHTYVNRSALRFDGDEPGEPKQFRHPVMNIQYNDKPSMISETTWSRPNRFRSEAPLFLATYGALQDLDAIVHFALDGAQWSPKPQWLMQPWTLMAPTQMGQFPAAALIYRRGLVSTGALLADLQLGVSDLKNLQGTPLPRNAAFDELRLKDVPAGTELQPGNRLDPLIHLAGRTRVTFSQTASPARLVDLSGLVNRRQQTVRSSTGELLLDYGIGLLRINAPSAQGVSGNLRAAGEVALRDVTVSSDLDLAHIVFVSLDDRPLESSEHILLQVMSEEKSTGFQIVPQGAIQLIEKIGTDPWRVRRLEGEVRVTRPDAAQLTVTALDLNGVPVKRIGSADRFKLLPTVVYYLIE